jgi:hypothetical protein
VIAKRLAATSSTNDSCDFESRTAMAKADAAPLPPAPASASCPSCDILRRRRDMLPRLLARAPCAGRPRHSNSLQRKRSRSYSAQPSAEMQMAFFTMKLQPNRSTPARFRSWLSPSASENCALRITAGSLGTWRHRIIFSPLSQ